MDSSFYRSLAPFRDAFNALALECDTLADILWDVADILYRYLAPPTAASSHHAFTPRSMPSHVSFSQVMLTFMPLMKDLPTYASFLRRVSFFGRAHRRACRAQKPPSGRKRHLEVLPVSQQQSSSRIEYRACEPHLHNPRNRAMSLN